MFHRTSFSRIIFVSLVAAAISACGGGGGGSNPSPTVTATPTITPTPTPTPTMTPDVVPSDFSFTPATNAMRSMLVPSNAITVSGIDAPTEISVSDGAMYSINDGDFTADVGTVVNDQTVAVRIMASADFNTPVMATLTIGGVMAGFTVTTQQDNEPDAFADILTDEPSATKGQTITRGPVTVAGVAVEIPVSVSDNAMYSLDGTNFVANPDVAPTLANGQRVWVRVNASETFTEMVNASLTLGSVTESFTVTTEAQDITPDAFDLGADVTGATRSTERASAIVTIAGINDPAAVTIDVGEFSIAGGARATTGNVSNGETVQVFLDSAAEFNTAVVATLNVGGVTDTFSVTTELDNIPNQFELGDNVTGATVGSVVTVGPYTIEGIETAVPVTVNAGVSYSINGEAFITEGGSVENGDEIRLRVTASNDFLGEVTVTFTLNGISDSLVVQSEAADTTPDAFDLGPGATGVDQSTEFNSLTPTIQGINSPAPVTIDVGEFSINGGARATTGNISNGQTIQVFITSSADLNTAVTATLNIGGVTDTFSVTTLDDTTPPTATIAFPPPLSMTEGDTTYIRGTAQDDLSDITGVTVMVGGTPYTARDTSTGDDPAFSSWDVETANRPALTDGMANTLTVVVEDAASNENDNAASVVIHRDNEFGFFPDGTTSISTSRRISLDFENNRLLLAGADLEGAGEGVVAVSLETLQRSMLATTSTGDTITPIRVPGHLLIDESRDRAWLVDGEGGNNVINGVFNFDLASGVHSVLSTSSISTNILTGELLSATGEPNSELPFNWPVESIVHPYDNNELLVLETKHILTVSIDDVLDGETVIRSAGQRGSFSSAITAAGKIITPDSLNPFTLLQSIVFYEGDDAGRDDDRLFAVDSNHRIFRVDMENGARTVFSLLGDSTAMGDGVPNNDGPTLEQARGADLDVERKRLLVATELDDKIVAVDVNSGARSEVSGEITPNSFNAFDDLRDVLYDSRFGYAFVLSRGNQSIMAMDILTGERVVLTKSVCPSC